MRHRESIRVRYAETDQFGVVNNTHYLRWLEVGRTEFLRALGMPLSRIEAGGNHFLMAEVNIRYLAPARYDEMLELETWLSHVGDRSIAFEYRVIRGNEEIASARTVHVCTDSNGSPRPIPADLREKLREAVE